MLCCFINYCFLIRGLDSKNRRNSIEFSVDFLELKISRNHMSIRWVGIPIFQTDYDIVKPCEFLVGFREIGTHLRTRGGCHVPTSGSMHDI